MISSLARSPGASRVSASGEGGCGAASRGPGVGGGCGGGPGVRAGFLVPTLAGVSQPQLGSPSKEGRGEQLFTRDTARNCRAKLTSCLGEKQDPARARGTRKTSSARAAGGRGREPSPAGPGRTEGGVGRQPRARGHRRAAPRTPDGGPTRPAGARTRPGRSASLGRARPPPPRRHPPSRAAGLLSRRRLPRPAPASRRSPGNRGAGRARRRPPLRAVDRSFRLSFRPSSPPSPLAREPSRLPLPFSRRRPSAPLSRLPPRRPRLPGEARAAGAGGSPVSSRGRGRGRGCVPPRRRAAFTRTAAAAAPPPRRRRGGGGAASRRLRPRRLRPGPGAARAGLRARGRRGPTSAAGRGPRGRRRRPRPRGRPRPRSRSRDPRRPPRAQSLVDGDPHQASAAHRPPEFLCTATIGARGWLEPRSDLQAAGICFQPLRCDILRNLRSQETTAAARRSFPRPPAARAPRRLGLTPAARQSWRGEGEKWPAKLPPGSAFVRGNTGCTRNATT
ncbi:uncharacterized protein DKFZp434B061-like [Dipodomys spectabilis]|uniref:uncharacterized protein DKFZp434B061-like n=1 Tax=Dipodomys spectabilis TaxID=105255 RepID=UPI001C54ABC7|nr:uncharacterized protein DKFZp434B061-like [Dipodomys spectabilis]